jgi:signal transduction histidine kinase
MTQFVAVAGRAGDAPDAPLGAPPRDRAVHRRDNALRAALAGAPLALGSFAFALAAQLWLLPASSWHIVSAVLIVVMLAVASVAPRASTRPRSSARTRRRWLRTYAGLGAAMMATLAIAPWLPGTEVLPDERLLFVLLIASPVISAVVTFASLRIALAFAVAPPLSAALADWRLESRWATPLPAGVIIGFALAIVVLAIGLLSRRAWGRAVAGAADRDARLTRLEFERDAAERADQEKSRFLAIASHDLRQPVHALGLFATTLEKRLRGSGEEAIVRNIVRSIDGLDRSFNAMLDISRLDAGTIEPNFQHFPLRDLFRRLDMYFSGLAEQARLGLRLAPGGKSVTSDPQLLERILGNLIQNAIKYTERGGIVVVARTTATHLNLEVWDTGMGIREVDLPHIFEEFYQVSRRERARIQGLGMGLAIVKRLAILLGHSLTVKSRPGQGTMFRIGIPIGDLPGIVDDTAAADTLPMAAQQPHTIMILDDDEAIRDGLALLLEEWGYQAIAAASFQQAERLARTLDLPPDLVLSDLHLGDGPDGIDAIEAIRRACGCEIPAILITGDTSHEELRRASDSGHMVLCKPVQPRKLLSALRGLVV